MALLLAVPAAAVIWAIVIYNLLVRDRNRVAAAWSDIDVQLKRRYDLIPKLVELVKQYSAYERSTLEAVTALRSRGTETVEIGERAALESELGGALRRLIAVAEAYPELRASENFLDLQQNLSDVEDHIQYARRYYNGAVKALNIRTESFPDRFVAAAFGFRAANYFRMDEP